MICETAHNGIVHASTIWLIAIYKHNYSLCFHRRHIVIWTLNQYTSIWNGKEKSAELEPHTWIRTFYCHLWWTIKLDDLKQASSNNQSVEFNSIHPILYGNKMDWWLRATEEPNSLISLVYQFVNIFIFDISFYSDLHTVFIHFSC